MDAHLAEAFQKYDEYSAALATTRDAAAKLESDVAYWRDQIVARAGGAKPRLIEPKVASVPAAKPAAKAKAAPAPAPKAAPKPAPAASRDAEAKPRGVWTEQAARLLWPALTPEWQARFRKLLVGPLPVAKLFPGESRPGPLFAGLTWKSRSATHINSSPVITEDGTARLADGLDVALRAAGIVP